MKKDYANILLGDNEAAVIFIHTSLLGMAVKAFISEYTEDNAMQFLGILPNNSKLLHITTPGKHEYLVKGEKGGVIQVHLEAKKFYYIYVKPRFGVVKARFDFVPVVDLAASTSLSEHMKSASWQTDTNKKYEKNTQDLQEQYEWAVKNDRVQIVQSNAGFEALLG